jgi:hypothetical protein
VIQSPGRRKTLKIAIRELSDYFFNAWKEEVVITQWSYSEDTEA